jgi:hypothetical protein
MNVSYVKLEVMKETAVATATATATTATTKPIPLDDIDLKIIKVHSLLYSLVNIKRERESNNNLFF